MDNLPLIILAIMREERIETLHRLSTLRLAEDTEDNLLSFCASLQATINETIAERMKALGPQMAPASLWLIADELDRIVRRMREMGISPPMH